MQAKPSTVPAVSPTGSTAVACQHSPGWGDGVAVSVLILNWNGRRFLGPCLRSVLQDACKHVEVVMVDNGSTDDSVNLTNREFIEARVVALPQNLGFGPAYNRAVDKASGRFVVFLNNDTEVEPGWLAPLIDELIHDQRVAITTSKVLFLGTRVINSAGGRLKLWTGGGELGFGQDESFLSDRIGVEPFYASGASMAMSKELFLRLGGFDEHFTLYAEDMDLSWRARLAGFTVKYVPASVVQHHYSGSTGVFNPLKNRLGTSHYMVVMIKSLSAGNLIHSLPAYTLFTLLKGCALAIAERNPAYITNVLAAVRELVASRSELRSRRRDTQKLRVASDRHVLRSEGFGLFESPAGLLRVFRQGRLLKNLTSTAPKGEPSPDAPAT